jgi:predicted GIY-YIG superfamily endonuclease
MNAKLVDSIVLMIHSLSPAEQILFQNKLGVSAEMEVLQAIYQGIPSDVQQRYDELREKLHDETLSSDEHKELIKMIDVIEQYDVERLEKLIQLAKIRNVSLEELMKQLNLKPTVTHV